MKEENTIPVEWMIKELETKIEEYNNVIALTGAGKQALQNMLDTIRLLESNR